MSNQINYITGLDVPAEVTRLQMPCKSGWSPQMMKATEIAELLVSNNEMFFDNDGPVTTTLAVAKHFEKEHKDVLRAVETLDCSPEYRQRNFALSFYEVEGPNNATRKHPMYNLTRDGFMFLVMGFTGKEAAAWKEGFIYAFNNLKDAQGLTPPPPNVPPLELNETQYNKIKVPFFTFARKELRNVLWKRVKIAFRNNKRLPLHQVDMLLHELDFFVENVRQVYELEIQRELGELKVPPEYQKGPK